MATEVKEIKDMTREERIAKRDELAKSIKLCKSMLILMLVVVVILAAILMCDMIEGRSLEASSSTAFAVLICAIAANSVRVKKAKEELAELEK